MRLAMIVVLVISLAGSGICSDKVDPSAVWRSSLDPSTIGKGDLDQTYQELLDYFFPRQPAPGGHDRCFLVIRYEPHKGSPHQLNLQFSDSLALISAWAFELPDGLPLKSSDEAQGILRTTPHSARRVSLSRGLKQAVRPMRSGIVFKLKGGIAIHGDTYSVWGRCDLSQFEAKITVPANSRNEVTSWIQDIWIQARPTEEVGGSKTDTVIWSR